MITFEKSLIPPLYRIRQLQEVLKLENPEEKIADYMDPVMDRIKPNMHIGIAAGSRGIYHYAEMIKAVVTQIKKSCGNTLYHPGDGKPRRCYGRRTNPSFGRLRDFRGKYGSTNPIVHGYSNHWPDGGGDTSTF
ncbi:MAG: hypothetical protein ACRCSI_02105 [Eubacterium aggregans]